MSLLRAHGRTQVDTFCASFREATGLELQVYDGEQLADGSATLASVRVAEGAVEQEVEVRPEMRVGEVEREFRMKLGLLVRVLDASGNIAPPTGVLGEMAAAREAAPGETTPQGSEGARESSAGRPDEKPSGPDPRAARLWQDVDVDFVPTETEPFRKKSPEKDTWGCWGCLVLLAVVAFILWWVGRDDAPEPPPAPADTQENERIVPEQRAPRDAQGPVDEGGLNSGSGP